MSLVSIASCHALVSGNLHLRISSLLIEPQQHTVVLGSNGSGKSALGALIAGEGVIESGDINITSNIQWVSVAQQQLLIEAEKQKDCADILDIIPVPTQAYEILFRDVKQSDVAPDFLASLLETFEFNDLLNRPFRALSSGETKKLLLAKAMLAQPELLILDEPWAGLDSQACVALNRLLLELSNDITLLFVINRHSEIPDFCRQILLMEAGKLHWQSSGINNLAEQLAHVQQLQHMQQTEIVLPARDTDRFAPISPDTQQPLIKLSNVAVRYGDKVIFSDLNWTIENKQHWQISGPNGSGKTCLLNLITGDHPQCYVNDINVFGYQRGNGESIWQIKEHIGYVSNGFHLDYKVNCSLMHVVLSGFYDSVGLYLQPTKNQSKLALDWLELMGLRQFKHTPFYELSFGDQRLALIARAMVKHPSLLILDEPCTGLDDINRLKVLALVEILARNTRTTLLYVNHHDDDIIPCIEHHLNMADVTSAHA